MKGEKKLRYYGYHRSSTKEQHLDRGINEIETYCKNNGISLKKIFTDQCTGTDFQRPRYTVLKEDVLTKGDILIITEVDRLGRNKKDTLKELRELQEIGVRVMILEIPTTLINLEIYDNSMSAMLLETINNMLIEMYASFAQAENEKRKKRQEEGIAAKKLRGEWNSYGRPHVMDIEEFKKEYEAVEKGIIRPVELMKKLHLKKATYYKYRKIYLQEKISN